MAVAKWAAPSAVSSNIASTSLDSLGNGSTSAFITYDNSTNRDYYGNIRITLGSITAVAPNSGVFRVFATQNGAAPDNTGSIGGGDAYPFVVTTGTSVKEIIIPMVRLYPESLRFCITNNTGVALASSGNAVYVRPGNEDVT
jgi:hypothetical protein